MSKLIKPQNNFTTIPNHIINDARLSFKSKGLFLYLISKPDGWFFSADRISNDCNDGKKSVLSGLKELENCGLLSRNNIRINGVFKGFDYVLSFDFLPCTPNGSTVSPCSPKRQTQKRQTQNGSSNKDSLSKKEILEEEKRNNKILDSEIICSVPSDYPLLEEYVKFVSARSKFPIFYASAVRDSLLNDNARNHNKSFLAYCEFSKTRPDLFHNGVLPVGVNIFDLIGRD